MKFSEQFADVQVDLSLCWLHGSWGSFSQLNSSINLWHLGWRFGHFECNKVKTRNLRSLCCRELYFQGHNHSSFSLPHSPLKRNNLSKNGLSEADSLITRNHISCLPCKSENLQSVLVSLYYGSDFIWSLWCDINLKICLWKWLWETNLCFEPAENFGAKYLFACYTCNVCT